MALLATVNNVQCKYHSPVSILLKSDENMYNIQAGAITCRFDTHDSIMCFDTCLLYDEKYLSHVVTTCTGSRVFFWGGATCTGGLGECCDHVRNNMHV